VFFVESTAQTEVDDLHIVEAVEQDVLKLKVSVSNFEDTMEIINDRGELHEIALKLALSELFLTGHEINKGSMRNVFLGNSNLRSLICDKNKKTF
jgi:hypothetical protein